MAADPSELYPVIAQIAAAFAGFGSLAGGLERRRGGHDARIDAYRLWLMLFASLSATFLGLMPATLASLGMAMGSALRVSALAAVVALVVYLPLITRRVAKLRGVTGFSIPAGIGNTACALIALAGFVLCAAALVPGRLQGFFLLGLMGLLGSSIIMFSRVIASLLQPLRERGD